MTDLSTLIVERAPLDGGQGNSGNRIERVRLSDGRELILKAVSPRWDWITRATGDDGRIATMWADGVFDAMPPSIDHAIVAVQRAGDEWHVFMRDVAASLLRDDIRHGADTAIRILRAAADVHDTFSQRELPALCSIEDRYDMLSPRTAEREKDLEPRVSGLITRAWEAFYDNMPDDIGAIVARLSKDVTPVAEQLRACEQTLVHGDLRIGNAGFDGDRTILLDWGDRTGVAPAAVDLAWFIGFDAKRLDMTRDDIVAAFRELEGRRFDERALHLALIGGLVHLGAHIGLGFLTDDEAGRAAAVEDAQWWASAVGRALETWSP